MSIQTLHDNGDAYLIPSKYDGGVYATAVSDCVCKGIGDEFTIGYSNDILAVSFNAGSQAVIGGSFFKVESLETLTLDPNTTNYVCANIDLTNPNGYRGSFVARTESNMKSDNLNGNGVSRDFLLYVVTTNSLGVSNVIDKRNIKGDGSSISGLGIAYMTRAQYEALPIKDDDTLYFLSN